jgi:hypothetical protein
MNPNCASEPTNHKRHAGEEEIGLASLFLLISLVCSVVLAWPMQLDQHGLIFLRLLEKS